jgi:D-alanyl-D-alanine carboxypeptidase
VAGTVPLTMADPLWRAATAAHRHPVSDVRPLASRAATLRRLLGRGLSHALVSMVCLLALGAGTASPALAGAGQAQKGEKQRIEDRLERPGVVVDVPRGTPAPPAPQATGWLLADLDSGEIIAAQGAHTQLAPASTLKVLTALALGSGMDLDTPYNARDADVAIDGSKVGLVPGSRYTVRDLLHGLMLGSGNDCAEALATLFGGDRKAVARMNEVAESLGAKDTRAATPSGLDAPGQVTTPYDLALISRAALDDPKVAKVMATRNYKFPAEGKALGAGRKRFDIQNHNRLLGSFPGATGGKTGFTQAARQSFVGSAERDGRRYVVTLLRGEGRPWQQAGELLDWAFANAAKAEPVGELKAPETGEDAGAVGAGGARTTLVTGTRAGDGTDRAATLGLPGYVWAVAAGLLALLVVWTTMGMPFAGLRTTRHRN